MENNALITLKGSQSHDGELNDYEMTTVGTFIKKDDKYYVTYKGSEITGYENSTTTLKIKPDFVSMMRFGNTHTQMIFQKDNKKNLGYYETPVGQLSVGVTTREITVNLTEEGGEVKLDYWLDLNGGGEVRNGLHVLIRKVENLNDSI